VIHRPAARRSALALLGGIAVVAGLLAGPAGVAGATEISPAPGPAATDAATQSADSGGSGDSPTKSLDAAALPGPLVALAAASTSFRSNDIITDGNMYATGVMSASDVQAFLNGEVPTCQAGYTCLKDARITTTDITGDTLCPSGYTGASNQSAATIIANVGNACGISQKVLLSMLQKESQLVDDDFPIQKQYDQAMGYECPDSGPCDPAYAGFFKQVYGAAQQLERYKLQPESGDFPVGTATPVQYNPDTGCGTADLTFTTQATASLYDYTPYQPNEAVLDGSSDSCSSFGNFNFWVIYTDWFGYPNVDVDRISGADRYSGSVAIANESFPGTAPVVYLANGANYPDALSAGPAAVESGGPLLLTDASALPASVATKIHSLAPSRVVIVGGTNSVSDAVEQQVQQQVPSAQIDRLGGADRYSTSRLVVADAFKHGATSAYIATGANFPDALSAGGAAGSKAAPVILVDGSASSVDSSTSSLLKTTLGVTSITIVGGVNSVSDGVKNGLNGIAPTDRLSGADRYSTSQAVNADAYTSSERVFLATGVNFPDALAGSALAGKLDAPLYVVPGDCVPDAVRTALRPLGADRVTLLGGPNSLGDGVENLASCEG
jgi:putative cell wall-binding protein